MDLSQYPKPPKRPLTPYMRFCKSIWQQVKEQNPNLSVCEIGATIGKMWRELTDEQKQKYNDDFTREKVEYDGKIQAYLKMTGLQASDLNKSKNKKKNEAKQSPMATPPPAQMGMRAGQMMQHLGYGNQAMMAPMAFSSSMASALPHFQQIWSAGQMYDQSQMNQMQLMAQQAQTNMMAGQQNGAAFFQQMQQQQQAHQQAQNQQAQAQSEAASQQLQAQQQVSPLYNGSPQVQAAASPHLNSTSPLSITPQAAPQESQAFEQHDSSATAAPNSSSWSWHDTGSQGAPFMTGQNGPSSQDNGLIAAAAHQAFGDSQAEEATRRMSSEISQHNAGTPQSSEGHKSNQPSPQTPGAAVTGDNHDPDSQHTQASSDSQQQPVSTQGDQAQQQFASAHAAYNSYANFPWGNFPSDGRSQETSGDPDKKVQSKETMLEIEVHHMRSALSEKTKEVQRLGQELEKAYQIIDQLKSGQQVGNGGGAGQM